MSLRLRPQMVAFGGFNPWHPRVAPPFRHTRPPARVQPRMPDLTLDGTSLHYETRGSGPPLLLNGVGLDLTAWGPIADAFGRERRLVLLDARGTGRSGPPPEPCTTAHLASDALALLGHMILFVAVKR